MDHSAVKTKMEEVWTKALQTFEPLKVQPFPFLEFSNRMKRTGGSAYYKRNMIRLNTRMLEQNGQKFIDEVVPHEMCHLIEYQIFKTHGHSFNFYRVGKMLGYNLKKHHNFLTIGRNVVSRNPINSSISMTSVMNVATTTYLHQELTNQSIKEKFSGLSRMLEKYENLFDSAKMSQSSDLPTLRAKLTELSNQRAEMIQKYAKILFAR